MGQVYRATDTNWKRTGRPSQQLAEQRSRWHHERPMHLEAVGRLVPALDQYQVRRKKVQTILRCQ